MAGGVVSMDPTKETDTDASTPPPLAASPASTPSRSVATRIAAIKAADEKLELRGAVLASDAFFPFRDGIDVAATHGIAAVIQPGGSKRDAEVIAAADEHGLAMVLTGVRHFRH